MALSASVHLAYLARNIGMDLILKHEKEARNTTTPLDIQTFFVTQGYGYLLNTYPVFRRLSSEFINDFFQKQVRFLHNMNSIQPELQTHFSFSCEFTDLSLSTLESHITDKNIHILTFSTGLKIVYKENICNTDLLWDELCHFINETLDIKLYGPHIFLARNTFTIQEYIEHDELNSFQSASQAYYNYGQLMGILYAFNACDMQCENIIMHGSLPVLVDTETFLQSSSDCNKDISQTYLLPGFQTNANLPEDFSALASVEGRTSLPFHNRQTIFPEHYVEDLCNGFSDCYRKIQTNTALLLSFLRDKNWMERIVIRPTWFYVWLRDTSLASQYLESEEAFLSHLENIFLRKSTTTSENSYSSFIKKCELESLSKGCIPILFRNNTSRKITDCITFYPLYNDETTSGIQQKLRLLSDDDLQKQIEIIKNSFTKREHL